MSQQAWSDEELEFQIGQLFVVGFHGTAPSDEITTLIQRYHVGGIILFQRNIDSEPESSAENLSKLTRDLQQIAHDAGHRLPLFIGIDQENGLVTRIKPPLAVQLPGAMAIGATGSTAIAEEVAYATGQVLNRFGININYAPVADINSEPKNPVIGVRSFSDNPEIVGEFVSATTRGLRNSRVIPCVKHFPGHGDTAVDSHYGLPVISKSKEQLDACELVPFKRAVAEGAEAVMTAHISLPGLGGDGLPASMSATAIKILRQEMGFDGVVISDCLEMDAVRANYGVEKSAVTTLKSGSDSVMICHTYQAQVGALVEVLKAVKSGILSQETIAAAAHRVERLKSKFLQWPSFKGPSQEPNVKALKDMNTRQTAIAKDIYSRSATIIRSQPNLIPLPSTTTQKITILYPGDSSNKDGGAVSGEVKTRVPWIFTSASERDPNFSWIPYYETSENLKDHFEMPLPLSGSLILLTRNAKLYPWQQKAAETVAVLPQVIDESLKFIVIATCDPYDFLDDDELVKNYLAMYEPTAPAFQAAMDLLLGNSEIERSGRLPVKIPLKGAK